MSGTTLRIACSSIASSSPGSLWFTTTAALLENILGTGLISVSLVLERREKRRHDYALQTGLCGSFTTYGAMTTAAVDMFLFGLQVRTDARKLATRRPQGFAVTRATN